MSSYMTRYMRNSTATNLRLCEELNIGDEGFYQIDKGNFVVRLKARIVNKERSQIQVKVVRGNGVEETKRISPKNFVKASA